jgi:hypothetical protein
MVSTRPKLHALSVLRTDEPLWGESVRERFNQLKRKEVMRPVVPPPPPPRDAPQVRAYWVHTHTARLPERSRSKRWGLLLPPSFRRIFLRLTEQYVHCILFLICQEHIDSCKRRKIRLIESGLRMRRSLVVRASDCQCIRCNGPGFDPSIRRHSGI